MKVHIGVALKSFPVVICRYNVLILLITYVIPIVLIGLCSLHMSIVLWVRQPMGDVITPQLKRAKQKKKKVRIML